MAPRASWSGGGEAPDAHTLPELGEAVGPRGDGQAYDVDVVVVGAGPAGLAAATRLRWLKGYEAMPASCVLIDPDPPGGLAGLGGCVLTGPGWATNAPGILGALVGDVVRLGVPWHRARATGVTRDGAMWTVTTDAGRRIRAHAVVLATGFRRLHGLAAFYGRGVHVFYKGYGHFDRILAQCAEDAAGGGLAILGHVDSLDLLPLYARHAEAAGGIALVLQPGHGGDPRDDPRAGSLPKGVRLEVGRTSGYVTDAEGGTVTGVHFHPTDASRGESDARVVPARAVLVDYYAFESRPERWLAGADAPAVDARGFVEVDKWLATSQPGLFAAGDLTGRFASTAMAIGDGVCAGFSAYAHVFGRKFGREPSLYAYAPTGPKPLPTADDPEARGAARGAVPDDAWLVPLGPPEGQAALLERLGAAAGETVASMRARGVTDDALWDALFTRAGTLHRGARLG